MCVVKSHFAIISNKFLYLLLLFFLILSPSLLISCGKKGSLTLKSFEKPVPPSLLNAIHREDNIILLWKFPRSREALTSGFHVLKSSGSDFEKIAFVDRSRRSYIDTDFQEGREYRYKIFTENQEGILSNDTGSIRIIPQNTPRPPENISFKIIDNHVILSWDKSDSGVLFNVYKSILKSTYGLNPVNMSPITENIYKDVFVPDKPVYYTIRSLTESQIRDEGHSSKEIIVNPLEFVPSPPRDVQYYIATDGVYLSWKEPPETWVIGYRVYRSIRNNEYILIGETQIPAFIDKEIPATESNYRISALGPVKEGDYTEIKGIIETKNE